MAKIAKNTVCLWYDGTAEDAARFYAATFPDSSVDAVYRAPGDFPSGKQGDVLTVLFTVMGIPCLGLNGGPAFRHNEAFSFQVATADQAETDRYWHAIVGNGGEESACGWCKDKWGVSWQITPLALTEAITDPDPAAAKRAFDAMMTMQKIDIATIQAARRMKTVKPNRVTRTYTQRLVAAPASVLPLLCPVREADWIVGWDPLLVVSQSGLAERDCVFITSAEPDDSIWYITRHEPEAGLVEMLKITPAVTACRLTIQVSEVAGGSEATITYSHTSLGAAGDEFVASFTEDYYCQFMQDWETRVNHYLLHGSALA